MIIRTTQTYFLCTDYVPDIVLGAGDIMVTKSDKNPCPTEKFNILTRESKSEKKRGKNNSTIDSFTK